MEKIILDWNDQELNVFELLEMHDEASALLDEAREIATDMRIECDNNKIYIDMRCGDNEHCVELQEQLNAMIETVHFGYDECSTCGETSKVVYSPEEFNFYQNTIQMCSCGSRMGRTFCTKAEMLDACYVNIYLDHDSLGDYGDADFNEIVSYLNDELSEKYGVVYTTDYIAENPEDPVPERIFENTLASFFIEDRA